MFPKLVDAYSKNSRVVVARLRDKRHLMACRVLMPYGQVLLAQVIMRGKSKRCLFVPLRDAPVNPNIAQLNAEKKTQAAATFMALLHEIEARLNVTTERAMDLLVYAPTIVPMDWALRHSKEFLEQLDGDKQSSHLCMVKEIRNSSLCNPGDQLPSPSMQKYSSDLVCY